MTNWNWNWVPESGETKKSSDSITSNSGTVYAFRQARNGDLKASELNAAISSISSNIQGLWSNWTNYTRPLIDSLPAGSKDQRWSNLSEKINAVLYGIQGTTIFVFNDANALKADGRYWDTDEARPKTLAEAFEDLHARVSSVNTEVSSSSGTTDLEPLWLSVGHRYKNASLASVSTSLDYRLANIEGTFSSFDAHLLDTDIHFLSSSIDHATITNLNSTNYTHLTAANASSVVANNHTQSHALDSADHTGSLPESDVSFHTTTGHNHDGADSTKVVYTDLTSIPSEFVPSTHASSHQGGSDAVDAASLTSASGTDGQVLTKGVGTAISWTTASGGGTTIDATQIVYIDANRTDSYTEDGTVLYPYKTLGAAHTAVTDASISKPYTFLLMPGRYLGADGAYSMIEMESDVRYAGVDRDSVVIEASNQMKFGTSVVRTGCSNLTIENVNGAGGGDSNMVFTDNSSDVQMYNVRFFTDQEADGTLRLVYDDNGAITGQMAFYRCKFEINSAASSTTSLYCYYSSQFYRKPVVDSCEFLINYTGSDTHNTSCCLYVGSTADRFTVSNCSFKITSSTVTSSTASQYCVYLNSIDIAEVNFLNCDFYTELTNGSATSTRISNIRCTYDSVVPTINTVGCNFYCKTPGSRGAALHSESLTEWVNSGCSIDCDSHLYEGGIIYGATANLADNKLNIHSEITNLADKLTINPTTYTRIGDAADTAHSMDVDDLFCSADAEIKNNLYIDGVGIFGQATGTSPFTVASTTVVANLNADRLDGYHASSFALGTHSHYESTINITSATTEDTGPGINGNHVLFLANTSGGDVTIGSNWEVDGMVASFSNFAHNSTVDIYTNNGIFIGGSTGAYTIPAYKSVTIMYDGTITSAWHVIGEY